MTTNTNGQNGTDIGLKVEPEGPMSFGIGVHEGNVFIEFPKPTKFMLLSHDEAMSLAQSLVLAAQASKAPPPPLAVGAELHLAVNDSLVDVQRADGTIEKGTGEIIPPPAKS